MNKRIFKKIVTAISALSIGLGSISSATDCCCKGCNCKDLNIADDEQQNILQEAQNAFMKDPEGYLKNGVSSAMFGWNFVCESFERAKAASKDNLEKLGFKDLDKSNDRSESYLKFINGFLDDKSDIQGIEIDGVVIRKNDKRSDFIRQNLTIFNLAKKFELIEKSIDRFADENTYKNNPELMNKIKDSLKTLWGEGTDWQTLTSNWNDNMFSMFWQSALFGYLNGTFSFYDNFMNWGKYTVEDCKGMLDLEFNYMDKATSQFPDFEPLNVASKFIYNYAKDVLDGKLPDLSKDIKTLDEYLKN